MNFLEVGGESGEVFCGDVDLEAVSVHGVAFVIGGELGERVRCFEPKGYTSRELGIIECGEVHGEKFFVISNPYDYVFE